MRISAPSGTVLGAARWEPLALLLRPSVPMPRSRPAPRPALVLLALLALGGCSDTPPASPVPREMVGVLVSPSGPEGAALVVLSGGGFDQVAPDPGTTLFTASSGLASRMLLVRSEPGEIRFRVRLEDERKPPRVSIAEVADGENVLRDLSGYTVRFERVVP